MTQRSADETFQNLQNEPKANVLRLTEVLIFAFKIITFFAKIKKIRSRRTFPFLEDLQNEPQASPKTYRGLNI